LYSASNTNQAINQSVAVLAQQIWECYFPPQTPLDKMAFTDIIDKALH